VSAFNLGGGRSGLARPVARPGAARRAPAPARRPALSKANGLPPAVVADQGFPMVDEGALREF